MIQYVYEKGHNQRTKEKIPDKKTKSVNTKRDSAQREDKSTHSSALSHQNNVARSTCAKNPTVNF